MFAPELSFAVWNWRVVPVLMEFRSMAKSKSRFPCVKKLPHAPIPDFTTKIIANVRLDVRFCVVLEINADAFVRSSPGSPLMSEAV
jgi:hypothetical protein